MNIHSISYDVLKLLLIFFTYEPDYVWNHVLLQYNLKGLTTREKDLVPKGGITDLGTAKELVLAWIPEMFALLHEPQIEPMHLLGWISLLEKVYIKSGSCKPTTQ